MPTKQQDKGPDQEKQQRQQLTANIGKCVINSLGQPGDLHRMQIKRLWDNNYRVNVLVGLDASSVKVAHSFFLVVDGDGKILASTPAITKQY